MSLNDRPSTPSSSCDRIATRRLRSPALIRAAFSVSSRIGRVIERETRNAMMTTVTSVTPSAINDSRRSMINGSIASCWSILTTIPHPLGPTERVTAMTGTPR